MSSLNPGACCAAVRRASDSDALRRRTAAAREKTLLSRQTPLPLPAVPERHSPSQRCASQTGRGQSGRQRPLLKLIHRQEDGYGGDADLCQLLSLLCGVCNALSRLQAGCGADSAPATTTAAALPPDVTTGQAAARRGCSPLPHRAGMAVAAVEARGGVVTERGTKRRRTTGAGTRRTTRRCRGCGAP